MEKENFIVNRIKSIKYAVYGAIYLIRTENAIKVHCIILIIFSIIGYLFNISTVEWMFQFLAIGLALSIEALNTSIEKIANYIQPNFDKKIGVIKDVSAGAVLFSVLFGSIILGFIYIPKFLQILS